MTNIPHDERHIIVSHHEIVADPAKLEFYDSFGTAYINTHDGQRFMLNEGSDPKPQDLQAACLSAQAAGQNLYLRFGVTKFGYVPKIHAMGETALAAGATIPMPYTTPIGPVRTGIVIVASQDLGSAYIQEDVTGHIFALTKNFHNTTLFGKLVGNTTIDANAQPIQSQGSRVKFRENGHGCAVTFEILKP